MSVSKRKRRSGFAVCNAFCGLAVAAVLLLAGGSWAAGGDLLWHDEFDAGLLSSPHAITVKGKRVFAAGRGDTVSTVKWVVRAYKAQTGALLWDDHFDPAGFGSIANAITAKGKRVFAAGFAVTNVFPIGRGQDGSESEWVVRAYDAQTGALLWADHFDPGGGSGIANAITVKGNRVFAAGAGRSRSRPSAWLVRTTQFRTGYEARALVTISSLTRVPRASCRWDGWP